MIEIQMRDFLLGSRGTDNLFHKLWYPHCSIQSRFVVNQRFPWQAALKIDRTLIQQLLFFL